jgi:hypothetical protein
MLHSSRPQLALDGAWQFRTDPQGELAADSPGAWRTVQVPGPWQAYGDDLRFYQGGAWYQRSFEIPASWQASTIVLHFGAVDYWAEVWVNGSAVGAHEGGYLPFECDITGAVRVGAENSVVVKVTDPDESGRFPTPFSEISHGKQSWYGPLSGIWQSVSVEARPAVHIASLRATPDARSGRVEVDLALSAAPAGSAQLTLTLLDPSGAQVASTQAVPGDSAPRATLSVSEPVRWDVEHPALYTLVATLRGAGQDDTVRTRFGFRTFESRDGCLWLNDRPLMLRGALDQDYYPGLIATPPSYEFLQRQAQLAKRMGLNCLRCHIKVADPRYLEAADEAGLLVWAELPNWQHWTTEGGARGAATLKAAIERDWNHPSVVIWTVINESWGIDQTNPEHRAWLRSAFDQVKAAAGDRLVVDNSACFNNFHLKSDLDDYHFYAAMPDERARWSAWVRQFAGRPVWSYGAEQPALPKPSGATDATAPATERWERPDGYGAVLPEVERSGNEPLLVSEFGNWGLPSLASLRAATGSDPWWFETGDDWGDGVVYPHGVQARFERLGLAHLFGDYERFAAATRRAEYDALQFEIEEIRRQPSIGGYVITEFTDVHWECNGLLDMMRAPKMPLDALANMNADTVLILDRSQGALRAGEERQIAVEASHWGGQTLQPTRLRWSVAGAGQASGELAVTAPIAPRQTATLGQISLRAPNAPGRYQLSVELLAGDTRLAATGMRLAVYPEAQASRTSVHVYGSQQLRETLAGQGYTISDAPGGGVTVADRFDAALRQRVQAGERVVLLAETKEALTAPLGPLHLVARRGTPWQGSWASSFAWMAGAWPGDGILDDGFLGVIPSHVVTGVAQQSFGTSVAAGLCVGWIQKPVALTVRQRLGRGTVTVSTFRLAGRLGADPVADMILQSLLAGAES